MKEITIIIIIIIIIITITEQVRSRGNVYEMYPEDGNGFETQPGLIWLRRQTSSIVL
jgi:hypothetical protein